MKSNKTKCNIHNKDNNNTINLNEKYKQLISYIKKFKKCIIAFSGGVDSNLVLSAAHSALKDNILAITFISDLFIEEDVAYIKDFVSHNNIPHKFIHFDQLKLLSGNPENRCYLCKKHMFKTLSDIALKRKYDALMDGSNYDDLFTCRPGKLAAVEHGVISPLEILKLDKETIRAISNNIMLPTAKKPSAPCLLTRFPHGFNINKKDIDRIAFIEKFLKKQHHTYLRVRYINDNTLKIVTDDILMHNLEKNKKQLFDICSNYGVTNLSFEIKS